MKLRYYMRGLGIGIFVTAILMAVTIHGKTERLTDEQIIERAEALGMEMKYSSDVLADTVSENQAESTETGLSAQVKEETSLANQLAAEEKTENPLLNIEAGNKSVSETDGKTDSLQQDIYHEDPDAAERTETKTDGSADTDSAEEGTTEESAADAQDESTTDDTEQTDAAGSSTAESGAADADVQAAGSKQITVSSGDGSDTVARKLYEAGLVSDAAAYDKYLCQNGYDKKICTGVKTIPAGSGEAEIAKILTTR